MASEKFRTMPEIEALVLVCASDRDEKAMSEKTAMYSTNRLNRFVSPPMNPI